MRSFDYSGFVCPATGEALSLETHPRSSEADYLRSASGRIYPIHNGIPVLLAESSAADHSQEVRQNQDYYRAVGKEYDAGMTWLFESFYADERKVRNDLADKLGLRAGSRVLEVGCGTGRDILNLSERIGRDGHLFASDLSLEMLNIGLERLETSGDLDRSPASVSLFVSDATALPLPDNYFDAVFHFGGINLFSDRRRGIAEMARVTKPGGRVVFGDEGVAPWLGSGQFGQILKNSNPLYRHSPPIESLPVEADEVSLGWILGGAFYVIDFVKREGPPRINLDLPIPGRRGGTHRSRFFGQLEGIDPALRDRASAAAQAEGVSFQQWLERIIHKNT